MMFRGVMALTLLSACLVVLSGCGDGNSGGGNTGPSIEKRKQLAQEDPNPATKAQSLIGIAREEVSGGNSFGARKTLRMAHDACKEIEEVDLRAELFANCAAVQIEAKKRSDGRKSLEEAIAAVQKMESPENKVRRLAKIGELQFLLDDAEEAGKSLSEAESLAVKLENPTAKVAALRAIATGFFKIEKSEDANRSIQSAHETAAALEDITKRCRQLADVAETQAAIDQKEAAEKTFDEALAGVDDISGSDATDTPYKRAHALAEIARQLYKSGFKAKGKDTLDKAEVEANKVTDGSFRRDIDVAIEKIRVAIHEKTL